MSRSRHSRARKMNIMPCYHHGATDAEERAIEHRERQQAKKALDAERRAMNIDVMTVIKYDMNDPTKSVVYTNAKPAVVPEILTEWCVAQMGTGRDTSEGTVRDAYTIELGLALSGGGDNFCVKSDTDSPSLTLGIVMDVLARGTLPVKPLEELP